MSVIDEISAAVARVVEAAAPAVVGLERGPWAASGAVVGEGAILTCARVLRRDALDITFADGSRREGRVRALDADADLALIDADTAGAEPLRWSAAAGALALGAPVFALTNPGGRGLHASFGLVSSTGRSLRGPRGRRLPPGIEHTAPLARGSSGSPLLDAEGALLGLNSARLEGGLVLALPADADLRARVERLLRGEAPPRLALGIAVAPAQMARRLRRAVGLPEQEGLLVREVGDPSPARDAGLEPGDLITAAAGAPVRGLDDLYREIDARSAGDVLELGLLRGLEQRRATLRLSEERG